MTLVADVHLRRGTLRLDVGFTVHPGQVLAVLGPNGAGKSTILRALAGLTGIERGRIALGTDVVDEPATATFVQPEHRPVGLVFQDHLLFPHLDVIDNVAFGARARGRSRPVARAEAQVLLDRFGLGDEARAPTAALSGGQAQRVALARALATNPRLLLLDEPLAALDATIRPLVRRDLRRHLGEFDGVTVLVTHDPLDALALADEVLVLEGGQVSQSGSLAEVTARPRSRYVADLIGVNLLHGRAAGTTVDLVEHRGRVVVASAATGPVLVLIHPHSITLHADAPEGSARNRWPGTIEAFDLLGDRVRVRIAGDVPVVAEVTPAAVGDLGLTEGGAVWATVKATDITTYPA